MLIRYVYQAIQLRHSVKSCRWIIFQGGFAEDLHFIHFVAVGLQMKNPTVKLGVLKALVCTSILF